MQIGQHERDGQDGPSLDWQDGVPVARVYADPYYSAEDGLAETELVFLRSNDLPARLRDGFHVAELGFGTGLNALATARVCTGAGRVRFTSFEAYPMTRRDMDRALSAFPALGEWRDLLLGQWPGRHIMLGALDLEVIPGDVRDTLGTWPGMADAWFLDGFSPARNPEMWGGPLLAEVARHTAPGGTFATYTAAGHVRRALAQGGFAVERVPGFGRKRHMSRGVLR